jgi:5-formyltetrahydrofolate cyclo-ligase
MMNSISIFDQKKMLRHQYETLRADLSLEERENCEHNILEHIVHSEIYHSSNIICSFVSFGTEVSTKRLNEKILESGKMLCLPRIVGIRTMDMIIVHPQTSFDTNKYGINEPIGKVMEFSNELTALCILPLLSYDSRGHRLGYGGGFYDVFLQKNNQLQRLGISFSKQYSEIELPFEDHDVLLDMIVNEHGLYQIQKKKPA